MHSAIRFVYRTHRCCPGNTGNRCGTHDRIVVNRCKREANYLRWKSNLFSFRMLQRWRWNIDRESIIHIFAILWAWPIQLNIEQYFAINWLPFLEWNFWFGNERKTKMPIAAAAAAQIVSHTQCLSCDQHFVYWNENDSISHQLTISLMTRKRAPASCWLMFIILSGASKCLHLHDNIVSRNNRNPNVGVS